MAKSTGGEIIRVRRGGAASHLGMRKGDRLLRINGQSVQDVLDVQYIAADGIDRLEWERAGRRVEKQSPDLLFEPMGLEFQHPTFDIDIRRCNNRCLFCFVVQMAPGLRSTLHIKDDDYRYSFLYGHFVTLTNLREADWRKIAEQRLSPLYVSVQATEPDVRIAMLRNPNAGDIMDRLRFLQSVGIIVHAQIVLAPGWNDGDHLRRTVDDLAGLFPSVRSCTVVPVGLTRFHRHGMRVFTPAEKRRIITEVGSWQQMFYDKIGSRFVFLTDEWYLSCGIPVPPLEAYEEIDLRENGLGLVRAFLDESQVFLRQIGKQRIKMRAKSSLLLTGTLFAPILHGAVLECNKLTGSRMRVLPVVNEGFGETVTVAGLLTGKDVLRALAQEEPLPDMVFLPRVMFDHPQALALDGLTPVDIARACGRTVGLVDSMKDVVLQAAGKGGLCVHPGQRSISQTFLKMGGWIE
jgi:putative radical SAM enzyme (TIGR03279 family)